MHLRVVGILFGYEGNARVLAPGLFSFPALIPPKHKDYPAVEDAIWQGIREALLGHKSVEEALRETEAESEPGCRGRPVSKEDRCRLASGVALTGLRLGEPAAGR